MAFTRLLKALAAFTLVSSAIQSVTATSSSSTGSICSTSSKCIPFTIEATWGPTDPSKGISRNAILTNGSLPGPPLRMKVGDCVDFTVINNMPNATGVHFHGIRQLGTPWADGVPGVSQYAIQPGTSYMYQWTAEESGNYFYHAHYKGQMMDGFYGAIIIAPADDAQTPFSQISSDETDLEQMTQASLNVETVFVSEWNRFTFAEFFEIEQTANVDLACSDSVTLNGFGSQYCPSIADLTASAAAQVPLILNGSSLTAKGCVPPNNPVIQGAQFKQNLAALPAGAYNSCTAYTGQNFTYTVDSTSGWAAISFISTAGVAQFRATIDSHKLYVYEVNGHYIVPQTVDEVDVANGERISFFVKLDQTPGDYTIRVANSGINQVLSGFGVLSYKGGNNAPMGVSTLNYGGQNTSVIVDLNRVTAAPFPASSVAATADTSFVLDILKSPAQPADSWAWTLSGVESYNQTRDDEVPPLLFQNVADIPASDLILETQFGKWVDLIIKVQGPVAEPHPIHKHANKFYMIGAGVGDFNFTNVADAVTAGYKFNFQNPPYVDGFTSIPAEGNNTWMVFRYEVNTPGAWLLHCHVQSHFSGGMAVGILDAVDQFPVSPSDVGKVCPGSGTSSYPSTGSSTNSTTGYGSQVVNNNASTTSSATVATFTGAASSTTVPYSAIYVLLAFAFTILAQ